MGMFFLLAANMGLRYTLAIFRIKQEFRAHVDDHLC